MNLPGSGEDLSGVGAYGIDGAFVTSDLSDRCEVVHVPDFQHAAAAGAQQHGPSGHVRQRAHPVLVGVWDLLRSRGRDAFRIKSHKPVHKTRIRRHRRHVRLLGS